MRAVFRYPGSKWGLAEWIIQHFPVDYEHMVYLEPFAGSAAVFFNKKPGIVETINDLNGDVVNLFRVLRESPEQLMRKLQLTPYSREEYRLSVEPCEDPIEKARRFMVRTTQAIGAKPDSGWRNHKQAKVGGTACKWNGITETLDAAANRLKGNTKNLVQIENTDAIQLIKKYNFSDVLMYLDPPYVKSTRRTNRLYRHEMDENGQIEMLEAVTKSKAKIILSGYQSDLYDSRLEGWKKDTIQTRTTAADMATETIWMNYTPPIKQITIYEIEGGVKTKKTHRKTGFRKGWFLKIDINKFFEGDKANMSRHGFNDPGEGLQGLTTPGKCESCNKAGARFRFENEYADPVIRMDLCPKCARKAVTALAIYLRTPAGRKALKERNAQRNGVE